MNAWVEPAQRKCPPHKNPRQCQPISAAGKSAVFKANGPGVPGLAQVGHPVDTARSKVILSPVDGKLHFDLLFDMAQDAIFVTRADNGRILRANEHARAWTGRTEAELRNAPFTALLSPADRAWIESALLRNSGGGLEETDVSLLRKNARPLPCELTARAAKHRGIAAHVILLRDLSERVRAMEDINLRNEAIASVSSGVTIADARHPDLPLIYVNRGFERITGFSAKEAVGRSCRFLQAHDRDQEQLDVLREALRKGDPCNVRLRNYRKDGRLFWNELHISPVRTAEGELTHFIGIQIDVTDRVRAAEEMRRALDKEKQLNEIKTRFIRMVSHEFRTPMTGIRASASFLRDYGDSIPPEKRERHHRNIENALERMNDMLDDVLFVSRSDAGKLPFNPEPVDIEAFCENLAEELNTIHGPSSVKFSAALPPRATFLLDTALLNHILHNLLSNAIKYSAPGHPARFHAALEQNRLLLHIEDTGIGIPPEDQAALFEPFHRAANVGTVKGTGLGLYIAKRSVELHSGSIRFTSGLGEGSRFEVELPAESTNSPPQYDTYLGH